ncbi:putative cytochrome P450 49a1 [Portunus trituberculatus]|uniref:Putative cytochrome P450 49a1 n=1 Tax=Portunus trituberculatus TaxID=210409 RepID=A0A5B7D2Z9_PORTR|nr:putative cytochrome P450 49a1 [Portunus trituberculatus]
MLRALRPVRCGLHATCLQNYFITQWDKSSLKWLTKGLRTAPTEAVAQDARVNTAAGGRTNNSSRNQEVRPFASIPGPKPLPLLGNQLFFTTMVNMEVGRRREELALDPEGFTQRQPFLASLMSNPDLSSQDVFLLLVEVLQGGIDAGLPYLRAVVQETLRLRPSSSARSRVIQEDTIVSGYFVPAGTFIISPPNVACHDPQTFPEPDKFKPDRWLFKKRGSALNTTEALSTLSDIENKAAEEKIDPYTVVAFGHGARMCPGRRLAEQEIHLALIQASDGKEERLYRLLVKSYKMELAEPGKVVGQVMRLNMMPDAHLAIAFTPR